MTDVISQKDMPLFCRIIIFAFVGLEKTLRRPKVAVMNTTNLL